MKMILEVSDAIVQENVRKMTGYLGARLEEEELEPLAAFPDRERRRPSR